MTEEEYIIREFKKTKRLLNQFGLRPFALDPGVRCLGAGDVFLDFGHNEWKWLKPLLVELAKHRKGKKS